MTREEQDIHRTVVAHLRVRGKTGLLWWHTPQGAHYANPVQGAIMQGLGTMAGVSDLLLLYQGKFHALELKAPKRKPTKAQVDFLNAVDSAGGNARFADTLDDAVKTLEAWGLLRGQVQ